MAILTLFRRLREQYNETEVAYDKDRFAAKLKTQTVAQLAEQGEDV